MHATPHARPTRRLAAVAATALLAIAGLFAGTAPALAHDELVGYDLVTNPADGAATAVNLQFNNEIMDIGTEFMITGSDSVNLAEGPAAVSAREVMQPFAGPLTAGDYTVAWRVVSSDGHPIQGVLYLAIAADGTGVLSPEDGESMHTLTEDSENAESENTGTSPLVTTLVVVAVAIVVAGAVTAVVIGSRRRAQAMNEAAAAGTDNQSASTEPDNGQG